MMTHCLVINVLLQLHGNYAMQGAYQEIIVGGLVSVTEVTAGAADILVMSGGLFYRYGDAIIPVIKMNYKSLAIGVSYDVNVSSLKEASNMQGGFELTLFHTGNYSDKGVSKKTVCPKF